MGRKSEARALKKLEQQKRFETAKANLIARVAIERGPRLEMLPDFERFTPKLGVPISELSVPTQPKAIETGSRHQLQMSWCVRKQDIEGAWSWSEPRAWSDTEFSQEICPPLDNLSGLRWQEIEKQSSDTGHRLHHQHEIDDLTAEARARWQELGLEEFDTSFRFRMGNTKRAWGIIVRGHFFMVWWERHHRIYPV